MPSLGEIIEKLLSDFVSFHKLWIITNRARQKEKG
jgi:hypothetical protein